MGCFASFGNCFVLLLVNGAEQFADLLEAVEAAFVDGPVAVLGVFGQFGEGQEHAQLVKSLFISIRLHLLHHLLKLIPVHLRTLQYLQVMLALNVENSAFEVKFAFAGDGFEQIFHFVKITREAELPQKSDFLRIPKQLQPRFRLQNRKRVSKPVLVQVVQNQKQDVFVRKF